MTVYRFQIAAANDAGQGEYSEIQEFSTCIAPPPSLKGISFSLTLRTLQQNTEAQPTTGFSLEPFNENGVTLI
jgi:hypothetical protein